MCYRQFLAADLDSPSAMEYPAAVYARCMYKEDSVVIGNQQAEIDRQVAADQFSGIAE